jgi:hypothetical protein
MSTFDQKSGFLICDTLIVPVILYYDIFVQTVLIGNATQVATRKRLQS